MTMNGQNRAVIHPGMTVDIVLKRDQRTGKRTRGVVAEILTNSSFHSRDQGPAQGRTGRAGAGDYRVAEHFTVSGGCIGVIAGLTRSVL
ncbi:protein of unknown function [Methanoculleus bourgensis]|uniref:YwbE family protein n=1 Tax=Methanoculleus bourgensis TaxID=83986 RepID=A0A0X8Y043_9EURY|nr:protein of unknown function [Methanoculleus bourgensis]